MPSAVKVCQVCADLVPVEREEEHMTAHHRRARAKQAILAVLAWTFLALCFAMLGSAAWLLVRLALRA